MGEKAQRKKDEKRLLEMMDEVEKVSWNVHIIEEALALAWKYYRKCERQAMMLQQLQKRASNETEAERNNQINNEIETVWASMRREEAEDETD